jgi:hypothetical protein
MPNANNGQDVLFNFKWTRQRINQLHQLSKHRGVTASAIIKGHLIEQFKQDGIDLLYDPSTKQN